MSIQTKIYQVGAKQSGSTSRQRNIITTISGLQQAIEQHTITSPTMLIIGPVVSQAQEMELNYA